MEVLAEFELIADSVIPANSADIEFTHPKELYRVTLSNLRTERGKPGLLKAHIYFESQSLNEARETSSELLNSFLHTLSFVTSARFKIHKLLRLTDWSPGQSKRTSIQYTQFSNVELPNDSLVPELLATVGAIESAEHPAAIRQALKWFSRGVASQALEDQFQYFWFAIEILAEFKKPPALVVDRCQKCRTPLFCPKCEAESKHRPFAIQAIHALFEEVVTDKPNELFEAARNLRNALLHGEDIQKIDRPQGFSVADIINALGRVNWTVLLNTVSSLCNLSGVAFTVTNKFTFSTITLGTNMLVTTGDEPDFSRMPDLPYMNVSLETLDEDGTISKVGPIK